MVTSRCCGNPDECRKFIRLLRLLRVHSWIDDLGLNVEIEVVERERA